jgi:CRISPR/Cas system-associated exonuclease Cas4 (RecB family)
MVHQNLLGVHQDRLLKFAEEDETLSSWWTDYTIFRDNFEKKDGQHYPEILLQTSINGHRLIAKYDLLLIKQSEHATIIDWKTSTKRPKRSWISDRLQTRIYPYVLVRASAHLNQGAPFKPEEIDMIYWYTNQPNQPVKYKYNSEKYESDDKYLSNLIAEIIELMDGRFPLTEDHSNCRFCPYRSLCDRGVEAGLLTDQKKIQDSGEADDLGMIFDQIAEIEY